jgi:hypothetical protein
MLSEAGAPFDRLFSTFETRSRPNGTAAVAQLGSRQLTAEDQRTAMKVHACPKIESSGVVDRVHAEG